MVVNIATCLRDAFACSVSRSSPPVAWFRAWFLLVTLDCTPVHFTGGVLLRSLGMGRAESNNNQTFRLGERYRNRNNNEEVAQVHGAWQFGLFSGSQ
ncbi:unnamed protein product [Calypogeia fissa]